jgi:uncharacterized membrane protein (DUF4010 family)
MPLVVSFAVVLGLGFFFGLAFEEFYAQDKQTRPGGVRTFPLLALTGAILYRLDSHYLVGLCTGLVMLGVWLAVYYQRKLQSFAENGSDNGGIIAPLANVIAYLIGPVCLAGPVWLGVGLTVAAVFLLTARAQLHRLAQSVDRGEILTAGKFLLLAGLVFPVLPDHPVTRWIATTPREAWLAVLAVCSVSYLSYLLQRYFGRWLSPQWVAVLGGLYSSTATTVVIARRIKSGETPLRQGQSGVILATAIMYLRLLIMVGLFDWPLCLRLAPIVVALSAAGCGAALLWGRAEPSPVAKVTGLTPANPLQLVAALVFAVLFLAVSAVSTLVQNGFGLSGIFALAAVVGFSDIDPFVLSLAQGSAANISLAGAGAAILIASSSNNVLKAIYVWGFGGRRAALAPGVALLALAAGGLAAAYWMVAGNPAP